MSNHSPSYERHRWPAEIIDLLVWLYVRFNFSLRSFEELLLERGFDDSYKTIRRWVAKYGSAIARGARCGSTKPGDVWNPDEVRVKISGGA